MIIAFFISSLKNRAGIERMTIDLANLLSAYHQIYIVSLAEIHTNSIPFTLNKDVTLISLNHEFSWFNVKLISRVRKLVKNIKPDIIVSDAVHIVSITAPALIGLGIPNISWEHFNMKAASRIGFIWRLVAPWLVSKTVVLTHADEKEYKLHLAPNITTIYNFTNIGNQQLTSNCENKIMIAVGRHEQQKGFDLLIRAWAKAETLDWKLKIVGSGSKYNENIELAKVLNVKDSIEFIPNTDCIEKEYIDSSCFVLSSRFEGLVLALIEAKMMGLPSICFDCPYSPKEVIENGIDGWLVESENVDSLSKKISEVIINPLQLRNMGHMAKQDAEKRFSKNSALKQWEQLFLILKK